VRRVHIPKGDRGETRPIGVPTFEDKVLQRAASMAMEAVYEQDFLDCSYGFRPGRSAHDALRYLRNQAMEMGGGWVLEADIETFFDSVPHDKLQQIVRQRVRDGVLLRWIGKWLKAGVMENGNVYHPNSGAPQGGVVSPLMSNVYLHEVLDLWFEHEVKPRLCGRATLIRYCDDFVILFEEEVDARRVFDVLPKRFGKYGLRLHPAKTKLVQFQRPSGDLSPKDKGGSRPGTFEFLGFLLYWGRSRKGNWVIKYKTASGRLSRALRRVSTWCKANRHLPIGVQHRILTRKLRGHDAYYGITWNFRALQRFRQGVRVAWRKWLSRRSRKAYLTWAHMSELEKRFPLLPPRIVHSAFT